ncbi:MAG: carbamoyltransferase HypF [Bacteroidales bacterium]
MKERVAERIRIRGLVQGVGFRPFIYRWALQCGLSGTVENRNDGVVVYAEGTKEALEKFVGGLPDEAPAASHIRSVEREKAEVQGFDGFSIVPSTNRSDEVTEVSPDIAVCDECLRDMKSQPHRLGYPLINCTHCGPRFSIIRELPYDRDKTTMQPFEMCPQCRKEYTDVLDRRFHAQPVACNHCGPVYTLVTEDGTVTGMDQILEKTASLIHQGKIIALKGVGGYQLVCDATRDDVVDTLRSRKYREGKPLAVMFRDLKTIEKYCILYPEEKKWLTSWRRPIVILYERTRLAAGVSMGFPTIGALLPYMPVHYLLFERLRTDALVFTSGNISEEPIITGDAEAMSGLTSVADAVLYYNREIYNRVDDSVGFVVDGKFSLIRRSRGFAPQPVPVSRNVEGVIATGAELVNCFAVGKGSDVLMSQHIGDLKNAETLAFYQESFERYQNLFRVKPELVAVDMHPDYLSTRFGRELGIRTTEVQHHHAHIVSAMAEYGLDEEVIGVSLDGTGLGEDGNIWGGEFLISSLTDYVRACHFEYISLPGGDKVTYEPWRTALSVLYSVYGKDLFNLKIPFTEKLDPEKSGLLFQAIDRKINAPLSSSAGRLFDAAAALLDICRVSRFHAEAPMRLEAAANPVESGSYPFDFDSVVSFKPAFAAMVEELAEGAPVSDIAARFHNTVVNAIFAVVSSLHRTSGLRKVVLSGGVFQNRIVLSRTTRILEKNGFEVMTNRQVPANDGGIALGQLVIAAARRNKGLL